MKPCAMTHTLDASPEQCATCIEIKAGGLDSAADHLRKQDAAIARAWRAAAGTEDPVREVLAIGDALADGVGQPRIAALVGAHHFVEAIAAALRREIGGGP